MRLGEKPEVGLDNGAPLLDSLPAGLCRDYSLHIPIRNLQ